MHPALLLVTKACLDVSPACTLSLTESLTIFIIPFYDFPSKSQLPPHDSAVWSLISAVGIFFLGAGASILHGLHTLASPTWQPENVEWSYAGTVRQMFAHEMLVSSLAIDEMIL